MPISSVEPWVSALVLPHTHRKIVQDLNRVNCFENFEPARAGDEKCSFVPCTSITDLITCKDFRVVLMMIGHKSFHIIDQFKRREKKKLCWLWNWVYILK